jgi:hypothetical protein
MQPLSLAALAAIVVVIATSSSPSAAMPADAACMRPAGVQRVVFTASKYPNIRRHFRRAALHWGWPRRLVVNPSRRGRTPRTAVARHPDTRRLRPRRIPASGRPGQGTRLERGRHPRGWKADVRYVPSSENRSHGASLSAQLEPFCNGTRFRYVFR